MTHYGDSGRWERDHPGRTRCSVVIMHPAAQDLASTECFRVASVYLTACCQHGHPIAGPACRRCAQCAFPGCHACWAGQAGYVRPLITLAPLEAAR
jgi:hypothetical protein